MYVPWRVVDDDKKEKSREQSGLRLKRSRGQECISHTVLEAVVSQGMTGAKSVVMFSFCV